MIDLFLFLLFLLDSDIVLSSDNGSYDESEEIKIPNQSKTLPVLRSRVEQACVQKLNLGDD